MRKDALSFLLLFFLGLSIVLGILLITTKRQVLKLSRAAAPTQPVQVTAPIKEVKLPIPRVYSSLIALPEPKLKGTLSVEEALATRRSRREFASTPLTLTQLSQMLWSAQGVTDSVGNKRTAPSAYEVYPYTVYVVARNVTGLVPGLYEYIPATNSLGDMKRENAIETFDGSGIEAGAKQAPVVFLLSSAMDKGIAKLKAGAVNSAYLEGGHIGQNIYLEAESLKLATVVMGGTGTAAKALNLDPAETIVYVVPIGNRVPPTPSPAPIKE